MFWLRYIAKYAVIYKGSSNILARPLGQFLSSLYEIDCIGLAPKGKSLK